MPIQIGGGPDHSFRQPLGLLSDCHRRIEHFLEVLITVDLEASGGRLGGEHRRALEGALTYFETAAPKHTADEENSLFPRLRASGDPDAERSLAVVERLERDHERADGHHTAVNALVRRWLEHDRLETSDAATLHEHLTALRALYRAHIAVEDQELFPTAARVLDAPALQQMGREMAARRGVSLTDLAE
jgi:hemerythrin-like domain-containing protein